MRSGKWWQALQVASLCLGALAAVVVLNRLIVAYAHWAHWLWTDWVVWFWIGVALGFMWHEAGHLLCATLGGLPVRLMSVGIGPLLWRSRIGNVRFDLRLLPFGGMVAPYPLLFSGKYRLLVFVLGGVLGNCALIAVVPLLAAPDRGEYTLHAVVAAQFFLIAANLLPFRAKVDGVRLPSDGLQVLQLLWAPRDGPTEAGQFYRDLLAHYVTPGNVQPAFSSASPRILYQVEHRDKFEGRAALQDYREALERELADQLSREEEMLVLDSLVTTGLVSGDPAFRERLDQWSLRALQLGPDIETLRGSRSSALVELGRWEEGKAMLAKVAAAEGSFDAFMTQIYLARAEHALGNTATAKKLAEAARTTSASLPVSDATSKLLPRLEAELGMQGNGEAESTE